MYDPNRQMSSRPIGNEIGCDGSIIQSHCPSVECLESERKFVTEGNLFKKLQLNGWRQFASIDIDFHDKLTVLTGANGSGKSTLLNILARHVGAERPYLSVPRRGKNGEITYFTGRLGWTAFLEKLIGPWLWKNSNQVGQLHYTDGTNSPLLVPEASGQTFAIDIPQQRDVKGMVIGSHRLMPQYQRLENMPFEGVPPDSAYQWFLSEALNRYMGSFANRSLIFHIKQALAAWAAVGEGNSIFQADPKQKEAYEGFVNVLRKILPPSLGFIDVAIRPPDVLLVTRTGEFLIDAASGGITNLIEIAALVYAASLRSDVKGKRFAVLFDEPENHLHPQLQRTLFKNLTNAFPDAQFVVATHSPFIVSSLKESNVYVLRYQEIEANSASERSRVVSAKLDHANRAGTASEILREVLGLPTTLPDWVDEELATIVQRYADKALDKTVLEALKQDLAAAGLSDLYSDALANLARKQ